MICSTACRLLSVSCAVGLVAGTCSAQPGVSYPRVYGPTGSLYGPTQAHYQYLRQYGRAWHGGGGIGSPNGVPAGGMVGTYVVQSPWIVPQVPYGYGYGYGGGYGAGYGVGYPGVVGVGAVGPFGWADYGPIYSYSPMAPLVRQGHPLWIGQNPFDNGVIQGALQENDARWNQPLSVQPVPDRLRRPPLVASPQAKLNAARNRTQGDLAFRSQNWAQAYSRYKQAVAETPEDPDLRFRHGVCLAMLKQYGRAADEFRKGLELDPDWPAHPLVLNEMFGEDHAFARNGLVLKVADWVREDIRDPDRLFVLGVLMHANDDTQRARTVFETAFRLAGGGEHLAVFLALQVGEAVAPGAKGPAGPVVPEAGANPPPAPQAPAAPGGPVLPLPAPSLPGGNDPLGPRAAAPNPAVVPGTTVAVP